MRTSKRVAATGLSIALLGGWLTGCSSEEPDPFAPKVVKVGQVLDGSTARISGDITVKVPSGPILFDVDTSMRSVSSTDVNGAVGGVRAADDAEIVKLTWERDFLAFGNDVDALMTGAKRSDDSGAKPVGLTLVAGEEKIEIPEVGNASTVAHSAYVVVPEGTGTDLDLEVTYDGLTQTADLGTGAVDKGAAAELYDAPLDAPDTLTVGATSSECPWARRVFNGLDPDIACGAQYVWSLPYVDGLGWAEPGTSWVLVEAYSIHFKATYIANNDFLARYRTQLTKWHVTLDGQEPVDQLPTRTAGESPTNALLAFSVPTKNKHELAFDVRYEGTAVGRVTAPAPRKVTIQRQAKAVVSALPQGE